MIKPELNCDLGESFGIFSIGNDQEILPFVDAINIACGFHAGDPHTMKQTIQLAKQHNVHIGAHPGFQDIQGFGRRRINLSSEEVYDLVLYQIGALYGFMKVEDVTLHHVKPHGALYNIASSDKEIALAIAQAVYDFDKSLILYGLANSFITRAGEQVGLKVAHEVFADRTYQSNGTLTDRTSENAVIHDLDRSMQQVEEMMKTGHVTSIDGQKIPIQADTICVHSDTTKALTYVKHLKQFITQLN